MRLNLFILILSTCVLVGGCKWKDDFRGRLQPQQQLLEPKPTFNEDSSQYVGDELAKGIKTEVPLESIDELSEIPELPEHPVPLTE